MSGKIMGQVWDLDLPQRELLVLLAITDHADHDGMNMFPGVALLAWKTGYSQRTIIRILNDLVKSGILIRRQRTGKATIYDANLAAAPKKADRPKPVSKRKTSDKAMSHDKAVSLVTNVPVDENKTHDTASRKVQDDPSKREAATKKDVVVDEPKRPTVFRAYEDAFGMMLTPMLAEELKLLAEEYTEEWVCDAMRITITNGKRSLAYAKSILRRWQIEGRTAEKPAPQLTVITLTPEQIAAQERQHEEKQRQWWEEQGLA